MVIKLSFNGHSVVIQWYTNRNLSVDGSLPPIPYFLYFPYIPNNNISSLFENMYNAFLIKSLYETKNIYTNQYISFSIQFTFSTVHYNSLV